RRWTIAWGFVLAFLASGLLAASAAATAPVDLGAGFVTDEVGALTADEMTAAELRLQDLASEGEADLFVVFVDDFTDPSTAQDWANDVADETGLGPQQYLLAIATEGRNYYISADEDGPLSFSRVTEIEQIIQPYLSDEDWAGAIDRAASE